MPHLETVAGLALFRFSVSKTILILEVKSILSPFSRRRDLLSSSTWFKFYIQIASTGPSQTIQWLAFSFEVEHSRIMLGRTPSFLSFSLITKPYNCCGLIDLGFRKYWWIFVLGFSVSIAWQVTFCRHDFPLFVYPIIIKPCLILDVA